MIHVSRKPLHLESPYHSPPRGCPAACRGEEAKGDRAEALAKAGTVLRRSFGWLSILCSKLLRRKGATDALCLGAGSVTMSSLFVL
jgi:hypothetical protein